MNSGKIDIIEAEKSRLQKELDLLKIECEEKTEIILKLSDSLKEQSSKTLLLETSMRDLSQQLDVQKASNSSMSESYQNHLSLLQAELR